MATECMMAHASAFKGAAIPAQGFSIGTRRKEFELFYDRRAISVLSLFVEGSYVGEAYCPATAQFMHSCDRVTKRNGLRSNLSAMASASSSVLRASSHCCRA